MSNLEDRALKEKLKILTPTDHPIADIVAKVLGAGLCTTSGRAERIIKEEIKEVESLFEKMRSELILMLLKKSFQYSEESSFKLASGRMSRFYVNCKPTILHPRGMYLTGHLILDVIKDLGVDGIGGLQFGACPISDAVAYTSELKNQCIKSFSIRKELKDHGIINWIEGDMRPGELVVIIDDVATTGCSTIKAIQRARESGLEIVKVVILVDRQEGGLENIRKHVADVSAIITKEELFKQYKELNKE